MAREEATMARPASMIVQIIAFVPASVKLACVALEKLRLSVQRMSSRLAMSGRYRIRTSVATLALSGVRRNGLLVPCMTQYSQDTQTQDDDDGNLGLKRHFDVPEHRDR